MRHRCKFARITAIALLSVAFLTTLEQSANAQTSSPACGAFYRVQTGDTLRGITVRAYPHDRYAVIFQANRDILANPAQIEVGQLLFLPCAGTGPQTRTQALSVSNITPTEQDQFGNRAAAASEGNSVPVQETIALAPQVDALPKSSSRNLATPDADRETSSQTRVAVVTPTGSRSPLQDPAASAFQDSEVLLLSAAGMEPLAGPELEGGGLVGTLIGTALRQADARIEARSAFVNDRQAHLDVLLPLDVFGLSYPWPAPDCSQSSGFHSRPFCESFDVSLPIYQVDMHWLALADDPVAQLTQAGPLVSQIICRPQSFPPFDLEKLNMRKVMVAQDTDACLEMLSAQKVDVVSIPAFMMEGVDDRAGFVEIEALRTQVPVHAVFWKASPTASALRQKLDTGLQAMQASGEWFRIVANYLSRFNKQRLAQRQ